MSNALGLGALLVAAAAAVLAAIASRRRRGSPAETTSDQTALEPFVGGFVDAVNQCESEADARYVAAVASLRERPESAARHIEAAYRASSDDRMALRQSLLLAAAVLEHASVLPFLTEVAGRAVSGEAWHDGGRPAEESAQRLIAVDGIDALARAGDTQAADSLVTLASSTDRSVQAAAVVALKYDDLHREHFERVRAALPAERAYLLDVLRASVRDVPQVVDPRQHLVAESAAVDPRPDPETGERRDGSAPSSSRRAPRVQAGS